MRITIFVLGAFAAWLSIVHVFFAADPVVLQQRLAVQQVTQWTEPEARSLALARMRSTNAEWDFMGRTFLVLALANESIARPSARSKHVEVIDAVIEETLRLEAEHGQQHFLLPYAQARPFVRQPARSLFVDGEIALMLAARQLVEPRSETAAQLRLRIDQVVAQMSDGPILSAESYPDEAWTFCNTAALAAIRLADTALGTNHDALIDGWLENAKRHLIDPRTGMLVSSYTLDGRHRDGPEGSSLFMAAHFLQVVDPVFAADQYRRAKKYLAIEVAGFGLAREWPKDGHGATDVDSGPIVPIIGASPGASGMAIIGAAAFSDETYLQSLLTSLEFAAFPIREDRGVRFGASNQVGDAVLLYALSQGPLFDIVQPRSGS